MSAKSDGLYRRRKAATRESLRRRKASRGRRKRVLVVCEDESSFPSYLAKLIEHLSLNTIDTKICGKECGSAPISVVRYGEEYLKSDSDFDAVFFVFDRDDHDSYDDAIIKINGLNSRKTYKDINIQAITSNPCFELWLKMHFVSSTKAYVSGKKSAADLMIDDLRKINEFSNYSKDGKCVYFDRIKGLTDNAIKNSEDLLAAGKKTTENEYHINPATRIHILVKALKDAAASYK